MVLAFQRRQRRRDHVIARLKRDKADDDLPADVKERASFLLAGIEKGEVKPNGAAKAME